MGPSGVGGMVVLTAGFVGRRGGGGGPALWHGGCGGWRGDLVLQQGVQVALAGCRVQG